MNFRLVTTVLAFMLVLSACKEEQVAFNSAPDIQRDRNQDLGTVDPVEPVEPVEPPAEPPTITPPFVKIVKSPVDHKFEEETDVIFEVIKGDNEIEKVLCFVDQGEIDCDPKKGQVFLRDMDLGPHSFKVVVRDTDGLEADADDEWRVSDKYREMDESLLVDDKRGATDILFVVDNSSSMWAEQRKISERFANFIQQIRGLSWHLGIATTDARQARDWSDGKLHAFPDGRDYLTSAMNEDKAQDMFAKHVRRRESGSDTEQGIRATFRAIERSIVGTTRPDRILREFFRPHAALAVVLVSDEDEAKTAHRNKGDNLLKYIRHHWGPEKVFQFNSIITHTAACLAGPGKSMGHAYEDLSRKTNGTVGDICADNYSELLKDIGKGVADLHKTHNLGCVPQDKNKDGKVDLVIRSLNGADVPGYTVDKNVVTFDKVLRPDEYEFSYYCLID